MVAVAEPEKVIHNAVETVEKGHVDSGDCDIIPMSNFISQQ